MPRFSCSSSLDVVFIDRKAMLTVILASRSVPTENQIMVPETLLYVKKTGLEVQATDMQQEETKVTGEGPRRARCRSEEAKRGMLMIDLYKGWVFCTLMMTT